VLKYLSLLCAFLAFGIPFASSQNIPSYVSSTGLVGWWSFTGNAQDASGKGNHGTVNGATYTSDRHGNASSALNFDGNSRYVVTDTIGSLNSGINTLSIWINASSYSSHHQIEYSPVAFGNIGRAYAVNTGRVAAVPHPDCASASTAAVSTLSGQVTNNNWIHLAFVSNGSICKFYINGVLIDEQNIDPSICTSPLALILGRGTNSGGPQWFTGKMDDVGIWNRALSASEITALYTNSCLNTIDVHPENFSSTVGGAATFQVQASNSSATYQWLVINGANSTALTNGGAYSGATSNALLISGLQAGNNNQSYRCIVSVGTCVDTSDAAVLTLCSGASTSALGTTPGNLRFKGVSRVTNSSVVPSGELWKIESIDYTQPIPPARLTAGTSQRVDQIQVNCLNITTRKSTISLGSTGGSNNATWETHFPIWLPSGTTIQPASGVLAINLIEYQLIP
jgi:hypothetical protein